MLILPRWSLCLAVVLAQPVRGDMLILTNGDRIEGQVVSESEHHVAFRRQFRDTRIQYVQKIPRSRIVRIERSPGTSSQPVDAAEWLDATMTQPADTAADGAFERQQAVQGWVDGTPVPPRIRDPKRFLLNVIHKWEAGQRLTVAADLTRLCSLVDAAELDAISPECESRLGMTLARWAAHVHWTVARARSRGGLLHLTGITVYELPELVPMIEAAYDAALSTPVRGNEVSPASDSSARPDGRQVDAARSGTPLIPSLQHPRRETLVAFPESSDTPADADMPPDSEAESTVGVLAKAPDVQATQAATATRPAPGTEQNVLTPAISDPADLRLTIQYWLDRPDELDVTPDQAAALAERLVYASSLLNERIRLDPAVRANRSLRSSLVGQRIRLIALLRAANARASGAPTQAERAAREQRRQEQLRQQRERLAEMQRLEREQQQTLVRQALRMAQEQARQAEAAEARSQDAAAAAPLPPGEANPAGPPSQ